MAGQCSTCDNVSTLIAAGDRDIEGLAAILGVAAPSLISHLKEHQHDQLHELTFRGSQIVAPAPPAVPDTDPRPSHFADVDAAADGGHTPPATGEAGISADDHPPASPSPYAGALKESPPPPPLVTLWIEKLSTGHPDLDVRAAAGVLQDAIAAWEQSETDRARLRDLRARRDQLQADLEEVQAEITCLEPDPLPPAAPRPAVDMAEVRRWAIANGIHVAPTGKIARAVVDDCLAAHPAVS